MQHRNCTLHGAHQCQQNLSIIAFVPDLKKKLPGFANIQDGILWRYRIMEYLGIHPWFHF